MAVWEHGEGWGSHLLRLPGASACFFSRGEEGRQPPRPWSRLLVRLSSLLSILHDPMVSSCVYSVVSNSASKRTVACRSLCPWILQAQHRSVLPSLPQGISPPRDRTRVSISCCEQTCYHCAFFISQSLSPSYLLGVRTCSLFVTGFSISSSPVFLSLDPPLPPSSQGSGIFQWVGNFFFLSDNALSFFCQISSFLEQIRFQISVWINSQCYSEWWLCVRHKGYKC